MTKNTIGKAEKIAKYISITLTLLAVVVVAVRANVVLNSGLTSAQIVCIDTGKGC